MAVENAIFQFLFFSFSQISNDYFQKSYGKTILFIIGFEGSYEVVLHHKYF